MTAVVRTLPGVVDHDSTPTGAIPVLQVVDMDANDYDVRLDLSGHIDLIALAKAIWSYDSVLIEWSIAMQNESTNPARRIMAAAELRNHPAVRAALTVKLTPEDAGLSAGSLAERLEEASVEPVRCEWSGGTCNRFADGDDALCLEHLADLQEHGPEWDRGSYQAEDI